MSGIVTNHSDEIAIFKRIRVLEGMDSADISSLLQAVSDLNSQIVTVSGDISDYWTQISSDNYVDPSEKQTLYREWKTIETTYSVLTSRAEAAGIQKTDPEYIAYIKAYQSLYAYLYTFLDLFSSMETSTYISNPDIFNAKFIFYYTALDALQDAIENGRDAVVEQTAKDYADSKLSDLRKALTSTQWITADVLASGLKNEIEELNTAAAAGFITDKIIEKIETAKNDATEKISSLAENLTNESENIATDINSLSQSLDAEIQGRISAIDVLSDRIVQFVTNKERNIRSAISESASEINLLVQNLSDETYSSIGMTAEEIYAVVANNTARTDSMIKQTASDITTLVNDKDAAQTSALRQTASDITTLVNDETNGRITYLEQMSDQFAAYVIDSKRYVNSLISQQASEVDVRVQNLKDDTWAALSVKEGEITAVAGRVNAAGAALSVQTDRIAALVSGYNAQAYMTAAVGLLWLVTKNMYDWYKAGLAESSRVEFEGDFAAVYRRVEAGDGGNVTDSLEWQMVSTATDTQKKTLINFLRSAGKMSSYLVLSADQIYMNGASIFSNGKLLQSATDYTPAATDATSKVTSAKDALAAKIGYTDFEAMQAAAVAGNTIINGGYIRTSLIDVDAIKSQLAIIETVCAADILIGNKLHAQDGNGDDTFCIDNTGNAAIKNADIQDAHIHGNSIFEGSVKTSTLIATEEVPAGSDPVIYDSTYLICDFVGLYLFGSVDNWANFGYGTVYANGFYNGEQFTSMYLQRKDGNRYREWIIKFYFCGNLVSSLDATTSSLTNKPSKTLGNTTQVGIAASGKTLKFVDLPTAPSVTGTVWKDSDGYLHIS